MPSPNSKENTMEDVFATFKDDYEFQLSGFLNLTQTFFSGAVSNQCTIVLGFQPQFLLQNVVDLACD